MNYTNIDDHSHLDKMADMIILNVKHEFSQAELKQEADMLAQCVSDKQQEENNKKVAMSVFKNKIDTLAGEINLHASNINHGFTYLDKATVLYRDFDNKLRVYFDKQTGDYLKQEAFHPSDFQKKLDFDTQEELQQAQIEENNAVGEFADPLDEVIETKKGKGKPKPKDTLPDDYGKNFEQEEDGLHRDRHGNLTD